MKKYYHNILAIEVDEKVHTKRNIDYEIEGQTVIEKELICKFIWINPNAEN